MGVCDALEEGNDVRRLITLRLLEMFMRWSWDRVQWRTVTLPSLSRCDWPHLWILGVYCILAPLSHTITASQSRKGMNMGAESRDNTFVAMVGEHSTPDNSRYPFFLLRDGHRLWIFTFYACAVTAAAG